MGFNPIVPKIRFEKTVLMRRLRAFQALNPKAFKEAAKVGVIQFLNWANNGSVKESRKPPIRWGVLRGSSSGFVGNDLVGIYKQMIKAGAPESPTPAETYSQRDLVLTWVWNTEYATRMHETRWKPGKFSKQDGNAGNKWVEKHLRADKDDLIDVIGLEFKKRTGM